MWDAAKTNRETAVEVFRHRLFPLVFFLLLFLFTLWFRGHLGRLNAPKPPFSNPIPAARPVLVPIQQAEIEEKEEPSGLVLTQSAAVGEEYFADAIFAGDSLTEGFRIYDVGQHFTALSYRGLSPQSAQSQPIYTSPDGVEMVLADAIKHLQGRKIYLMLGSNGMNWTTPENLVAAYDALIDQLRQYNPDTYLIIQSIPPVTAACAVSRPEYVRERVEYYNGLLRQLAMEKGTYFLDVYAGLVGEDGYLPTGIAAPDGMHMTPAGYARWFEYISTHTIKGDAAFSMNDQGQLVPMRPAE